ncbi:unnamed protein product [Camellia sinensis]
MKLDKWVVVVGLLVVPLFILICPTTCSCCCSRIKTNTHKAITAMPIKSMDGQWSGGGSGQQGGWNFWCGSGASPDGRWDYRWGVGSGPGGSTWAFGSSSGQSGGGGGGFAVGWGSSSSNGGGGGGFGFYDGGGRSDGSFGSGHSGGGGCAGLNFNARFDDDGGGSGCHNPPSQPGSNVNNNCAAGTRPSMN